MSFPCPAIQKQATTSRINNKEGKKVQIDFSRLETQPSHLRPDPGAAEELVVALMVLKVTVYLNLLTRENT
jgi:hypothetical protein